MNHLPEHFLIGTAGPDDFLFPYRWVNREEGNFTPVVHGRFRRGDEAVDAYAKLMDIHHPAGKIDCLNEISGWLIARACGLPVAASAFMASIRARDLPDCSAVRQRASGPDWPLYFFCTEEITRSDARAIIATDALVEEQARWVHSLATLTLDEWLGNADRHIHNLIRRSREDFALIDHGHLLRRSNTGPWWHAAELPELVAHSFANKLHSNTFVYRNVSAQATIQTAHACARAHAAEHAARIGITLHEISFWCSAIAPGHSAAWLHFLRARVQNAGQLLATRFGVLRLE